MAPESRDRLRGWAALWPPLGRLRLHARDSRAPSMMGNNELLYEPADVVEMYSHIPVAYELWGKLVDGGVRRRILALAQVIDGETVLDVGCGDGSLLESLARANPAGRTVGVDLAAGMLGRSRRRFDRLRLAGVELHLADVCGLPFEDGSFDVVTCAYVLDILNDDDITQALTEIKRILRRGGRLVMANAAHAERRRHSLSERLHGSGLPFSTISRPIDALPRLAAAGYVRRQRHYISQFLLPPTEVVAAMTP